MSFAAQAHLPLERSWEPIYGNFVTASGNFRGWLIAVVRVCLFSAHHHCCSVSSLISCFAALLIRHPLSAPACPPAPSPSTATATPLRSRQKDDPDRPTTYLPHTAISPRPTSTSDPSSYRASLFTLIARANTGAANVHAPSGPTDRQQLLHTHYLSRRHARNLGVLKKPCARLCQRYRTVP